MSNPEEMLSQLVNSINLLSSVVRAISNTLSTFSNQLNSMEEKVNKLEELKTEIDNLSDKLNQLMNQWKDLSALSEKLNIIDDIPNIKKLLEGNTDLLSDLPLIKDKIEILEQKLAPSTTVTVKSTEPTPLIKERTQEEKVEVVPSSKILEEKPVESTPPKQPQVPAAPATTPSVPEAEEGKGTDIELEIRRIENKFKHVSQMIGSPQTNVATITKFLKELRDELETTVGMSPMLYELNAWIKKIEKMPDTDVLLPDLHGELMNKMDDWLTRVINAMRRKLE